MNKVVEQCIHAPKKVWGAVVKYTTDGCSMSPDLNFRECCVDHDFEYARHHRESEEKRSEIDKKLRLCIGCKGHKVLAWVYWAMVRSFGWIPYWVRARRERLTVEEDKEKNGHS